ncbi:MAG: hypothetical protein ABIG30_00395 [Candidatus Aenigmatarchaeota archaeon]
MNSRKFLIVILIAAVIVVAGCTSESNRTAKISDSDGILINEFSADPVRANADERVQFLLDFENTGGTTATNIRANIYGAESWLTPVVQKTFSTLAPPDITLQPPGPGGFKIVQWELQPNNPGEGVVDPQIITARVRYNYKTMSVANIPIYTVAEYRRRNQISSPIDFVTVSNAKAPVQIEIAPIESMQIDTTDDETTFSKTIRFINAGSGVPIGAVAGVETDGVITGTVKLSGPAEFSECLGATSGNTVTITPGDVKIRRAESDRRICTIRLDKSKFGASNPMATVKLTFDLDYDYYVEESVTVSIVGQK